MDKKEMAAKLALMEARIAALNAQLAELGAQAAMVREALDAMPQDSCVGAEAAAQEAAGLAMEKGAAAGRRPEGSFFGAFAKWLSKRRREAPKPGPVAARIHGAPDCPSAKLCLKESAQSVRQAFDFLEEAKDYNARGLETLGSGAAQKAGDCFESALGQAALLLRRADDLCLSVESRRFVFGVKFALKLLANRLPAGGAENASDLSAARLEAASAFGDPWVRSGMEGVLGRGAASAGPLNIWLGVQAGTYPLLGAKKAGDVAAAAAALAEHYPEPLDMGLVRSVAQGFAPQIWEALRPLLPQSLAQEESAALGQAAESGKGCAGPKRRGSI